MHIILPFFPPPVETARRQRFGGLKRTNSSRTFHFTSRFRRLEGERKKALIPQGTGVVVERVEASGKVPQPESQTVRLAAAWYGRLIPSCIYSFTTGVSLWAHAVTENKSVYKYEVESAAIFPQNLSL